jgi:hypothetical protein
MMEPNRLSAARKWAPLTIENLDSIAVVLAWFDAADCGVPPLVTGRRLACDLARKAHCGLRVPGSGRIGHVIAAEPIKAF